MRSDYAMATVATRGATGRAPLISVNRVSKTYETRRGESVLAIGEVNLDLAEQEFVSLIGPSGCGKSTLLHVAAGLLKPTTGEVRVRGENRPIRAEEFGMVFQDAVLFPWLTIRQNVEMPAQVLRIPKGAYKPRAAQLLELVGLAGFGDMYPRELSGGMQQRAAIARALIHDPELLLMDEPFGAVDAITREHLNIELQRIRTVARKTVLFETHSISEAVFLSNRVVIMSARPSQVRAVIDIDLPGERGPALIESPEFDDYVRRVHRELGSHGH
jgi:NitT/TauT family transport system ATP-binding protein